MFSDFDIACSSPTGNPHDDFAVAARQVGLESESEACSWSPSEGDISMERVISRARWNHRRFSYRREAIQPSSRGDGDPLSPNFRGKEETC
jgi:hypothetical protein